MYQMYIFSPSYAKSKNISGHRDAKYIATSNEQFAMKEITSNLKNRRNRHHVIINIKIVD